MPPWLRRTFRWKVLVLLALLFGGAIFLFSLRALRQAADALHNSETQVSRLDRLPAVVEPVPESSHSIFDASLSPANFRLAASFEGDLFVAAASSLIRFDAEGRQKHAWRVGLDLPPFSLTALTVRRGTGTPELWAGTEGGGILIFDGQRLKNLIPTNPALRKITALLPLSDGRVVLGTANSGVLVSDGEHLRSLHSQFERMAVTALAGDQDELWIGTRNDGAWLWKGGEALHFLADLPDPQVLSLYASTDSAWIGTPLGVAEFSHSRFRRSLAQGLFARALLEQEGTLWVGTVDEGVVGLPLKAGLSRASADLPAENVPSGRGNIASLAQLADGIVAVSASAVKRFPSGETVVSAGTQTMSDGHITALHLDTRGRLWIGYFDRGLDIVGAGKPQSIEHLESDVLFCVNRIKEDEQDGTVAVATANGLAFFDTSARLRQVLNRQSGLLADHVTDLIYRRNGSRKSSLFIAGPAGISFVEDGNISGVSGFQGLVNNHVYSLAAWNGKLLAGTLGGFSILQNGVVESSFNTANSSLRQNWITASAFDGQDAYLGTYGSGVVRLSSHLDLKAFAEFSQSRVEINPNALLSTDRGLYAGTAGQGLAFLRKGEERWHWISSGLPSANVTALASGNNTLYIGTDNGLVSAPERILNP